MEYEEAGKGNSWEVITKIQVGDGKGCTEAVDVENKREMPSK